MDLINSVPGSVAFPLTPLLATSEKWIFEVIKISHSKMAASLNEKIFQRGRHLALGLKAIDQSVMSTHRSSPDLMS